MEILIIILLTIILIELTYVTFKTNNKITVSSKKRPIFVDTSVLIDGRIVAVAQAGFFLDKIINIPRSVIGELQFLADNSDSDKRSRARHGLDIVTELQKIPDLDVRIFADNRQTKDGVDDRLLQLAKTNQGVICTIDYNLNKVAQTESIQVLNINDLAMNLRMAYLPGERMSINLIQKGQESRQAVGHLPDGTMVVVENAANKIGQTVEIEFIRSLQTAAGRMMFAKLVDNGKANSHKSITKSNHGNKQKVINRRKDYSQNPEQKIINLVNSQKDS
ncbi:MAG: hypothetical protein WBI29_03445 [Candidatus Saccharimonadales bacterium]